MYVEAYETSEFDVIKVSYTMRLLFLMFVTVTVCVLFLLQAMVQVWPKVQGLRSGFEVKDLGRHLDTCN